MSKPSRDPLPWISLHASSWLTDTAELTGDQYEVLHRLLTHAWLRGGGLPSEHEAMARLVGVSLDLFKHVWPAIDGWFDSTPDNRVFAPVIAEEYARALDLREQRRRGADAANKKRWGTKERSLSDSPSDRSSSNGDWPTTENERSLSDSPLSSSSSSSSSPQAPSPPHTLGGKREMQEGEGNLVRNVTPEGKEVSREREKAENPEAKPNEGGKPNRLEKVLHEGKKPEVSPDLSGHIQRLIEEGHDDDAIVKILSGRGVTLMDTYRVRKSTRSPKRAAK